MEFPGFICYRISIGHPSYKKEMLKEKAKESVKEMEEIGSILGNDSQAIWGVLHQSIDGLPPLTLLTIRYSPHSHLLGKPALGQAGESARPVVLPLQPQPGLQVDAGHPGGHHGRLQLSGAVCPLPH